MEPRVAAMYLRWKILGPIIGAGLAACTQLPVDGPSQRAIKAGAATALLADRGTIVFDYAMVDITRSVVELADNIGPGSFFKTFGAGHGPAPVIRVGVGDIVQVSVFESASGGLFIPAEASVRPGNFVTLPSQTIDRSGTLTVPYAGDIKAAGRSIPEIQRDIEAKLANRAIEPQAVVSMIEQNATEVAVTGDVITGANKFRIRPAGERVLDIIARAGGLRYPGYELFVTLQRSNRRATVYFPTLINSPAENIYVAPGDLIYVYREPQKFVAVGALSSVNQTSGVTGQFAFDQERLSLNEAVAKTGGLQDTRADPTQVFVYRVEYRDALKRMGVDLRKFPSDQTFIPTIYRANFRDPSSFFYAQKFPMRNKDIIYVANADAVEVDKFLAYVSSITSTVAGATTNGILVRDVWRGAQILSTNTSATPTVAISPGH
jgi:polysaccharide biosynthesis/export protein